MKLSRFMALLLTGIILFAAGCAAIPETGRSDLTPTQPQPTAIIPTRTFAVTRTPTATYTLTPGPTATITFTPQPTSEMASASLLSYGPLEDWQYFFIIETEERIEGSYTALVDGTPYDCQIVAQNPNRLYCWGRVAGMDQWSDYGVYEEGNKNPVHTGRFFVPIELDW